MTKAEGFRLDIESEGKHYSGIIYPSEDKDINGFPVFFRVEIDGRLYAYLCCGEAGWHKRGNIKSTDGLINAIGQYIHEWYR